MLGGLLSDMRYRLRAVFRKSSMDGELEDEIRDHLAREAEKHMRAGVAPAEAMRRARVAFGGIDNAKESSRDGRGTSWLEHLGQDGRYAFRTLARNPGFAGAAVVSLALGIGANTAMFSALDAMLLRPLPVERPEELVTFEVVYDDGYRQYNVGYSDYLRIQGLTGIVRAATATSWAESFNVRVGNSTALLSSGTARVSIVTGNYFSVLGVRPPRGRLFAADDDGDEMGAHPVVVLSDAFWDRQFARAPDVVGRTLVVNDVPYTIIGVAPKGFTGDWVGWPTDFWIPSSMIFALHPEAEGRPRNQYQFKVMARLEPKVSRARAQAAADLLYARTLADRPAGSGIGPNARLVVTPAATGYSPQRESFGRPLAVLMIIVGAVLLIACANMANLQLARAVARRREIALRLALGAARGRIVRQLMTESLILALLGGAVGLFVAVIGMNVLGALARSGPAVGVATNANPQSVEMNLHLDARVLAFALIVSCLTSVVFGLMPALRGSKVALLPALAGGTRRTDDPARAVARALLVVAQVGLSVLLVVGTGLFVRTLRNLESQDLGFDRQRLLLVWALPGHTSRTPEQIGALWQETQRRLAVLPGVASVAVSVEGLLAGGPTSGPLVSVLGRPVADSVRVLSTMTVSPGFFRTIGQTIRAGREFTRFDTDSAPTVAIINESLARRLFGRDQAPIGQRVVLRGTTAPLEVVGVVADARNAPRGTNGPAIYYPPGQNRRRLARGMGIIVRTTGDPIGVIASVRLAMRELDPRLPILAIDTMEEQLQRILFRERLITSLSLAFAALAVILSCVGLYGVVSYVTSGRAQEIGIRIALGATRWNVIGAVLEESLKLAFVGIAVGIVVALATTRALTSLLYGIGASDPITIVGASFVVVIVAAIAGFVPAHRASTVNPVNTLRSE